MRYHQLKPLLQAAMAEAARLGAAALVVRQLDVDEVLGRCLGLALSGFPNFTALKLRELNLYDEAMGARARAGHGRTALVLCGRPAPAPLTPYPFTYRYPHPHPHGMNCSAPSTQAT